MTTFTKTFTITDEHGNSVISERTYRKMDEKTFKHYSQNPLGMDETVRDEMNLPENRYYSVSMWPEEFAGVVRVIPNMTRTPTVKKISKSTQTA